MAEAENIPSSEQPKPLKGRGISASPANRFQPLHLEWEAEEAQPSPRSTIFYNDDSQSIISSNSSPDIPFKKSLNPYRGCEHGCSYCYARPTHEYLGFSPGLDFESRIMVKKRAPELLEKALSSPQWQPEPLMMSGVTDCYQPIERKLKITRQCLEVLTSFRNPVGLITKNHLITRDQDLLEELSSYSAANVYLSITSLNPELAKILEPRASTPRARLQAVHTLSQSGIPVGVSLSPIIPGLNDHEIPDLLRAAAEAGARSAFYLIVRLPYAVAPMFTQWLEQHYPDRKEKVLSFIRDMKGGKLNNANFKERFRGKGPYAQQIDSLFKVHCQKYGLNQNSNLLSTQAFRRIQKNQLELF